MESGIPLHGACSCGRNHFIIAIPAQQVHSFQILYDDDASHSRGLCLRVPLSSIRSTTFAYFPDETHQLIRRVFIPPNAPNTKRHFCGYCGSPLSLWTEESPEEAEFVRVNVSSLKNESVERLQDAGLFDLAAEEGPSEGTIQEELGNLLPASETRVQNRSIAHSREIKGNPWFEEMIEGSELGRIRRRRGGETSADGATVYEWEIVEMGDSENRMETPPGIKRKLDDVGDRQVDTDMRG